MKYIFFTMLLHAVSHIAIAQKPPIDIAAFDKWHSVTQPGISDDGKYAFYTIQNLPIGNQTVVVKSLNGKWTKEIPAARDAKFSKDCKQLYYLLPNDGLIRLTLGTNTTQKIADASSYQLYQNQSYEVLTYEMAHREYVIELLYASKQLKYKQVTKFALNPNGKDAIVTYCHEAPSTIRSIDKINLVDGQTTTLVQGQSIINELFDKNGDQLAFTFGDSTGRLIDSIGVYQKNEGLKIIPISRLASLSKDSIQGNTAYYWRFTNDGNHLLAGFNEIIPKPKADAVKLDVWHHNDLNLQSEQLYSAGRPKTYLLKLDLRKDSIKRIQNDKEEIERNAQAFDGKQFLITKTLEWDAETRIKSGKRTTTYYLVDLYNNRRDKVVTLPFEYSIHIHVSPNSKYVVYFNPETDNYYSYDINLKITHEITKKIVAIWSRYDYYDEVIPQMHLAGFSGWLENDEFVLINDRYDIWAVDPSNQKTPINITKGLGKSTATIFYPIVKRNIINDREPLILSGFNTNSQNVGFYKVEIQKNTITKLSEGPYLYGSRKFLYNNLLEPINIIKAEKTETYILKRENAENSPNFFATKDFKTFTPVSSIHPEQAYNWLTTELHKFPCNGGDSVMGVLHKPANFDPTKKYPVIFYYYEKLSNELNYYHAPKAGGGAINFPYFITNGYLVFTFDIHYKTGDIGQSVLNSAESAYSYLSKFPWVDSTKVGINGHSLGGFETNLIVTRSNKFAAALSGAGNSNLISAHSEIRGRVGFSGGTSNGSMVEIGQYKMGVTPWDNPQKYIDNSPIFSVNKTTTPILLFHNSGDVAVSFDQSIELFLALSRLNKKVWILQYDNEGHVILNQAAAKDFELRMFQFFNHFLKGQPMPIWMSKGIPAINKGIVSGLDMDEELQ